MVFIFPLAVWFGILTILSLFTTACFGILTYKYKKPFFKKHMSFAFLTLVLAIIHAILVILWIYFGIII
ncbi:MAG: hypothetical protein AABW81_03490 [Nanoarchaeota archaeon]